MPASMAASSGARLAVTHCLSAPEALYAGVRGARCEGSGVSMYHGAGVVGMCGACGAIYKKKGALLAFATAARAKAMLLLPIRLVM